MDLKRLEDKVDKVEEKVIDLTVEVRTTSEKVDHYFDLVQKHVTSDERIVKKFEPLLGSLTSLNEIIDDHKYKKETNKRKISYLKSLGIKLGVLTALISIIATILKIYV